MLKKATVWCYD